jgi:hypothetical protein
MGIMCCVVARLSLTLPHVRLSIARFQDDLGVGTSPPRTCEVASPACSR